MDNAEIVERLKAVPSAAYAAQTSPVALAVGPLVARHAAAEALASIVHLEEWLSAFGASAGNWVTLTQARELHCVDLGLGITKPVCTG
jgi:hypothetical protein